MWGDLMNKLLLDDKPLIILPSLAIQIGLNEAIILQQMHYWLKESKHEEDGFTWIYNTYEDWQKQFPFWSETTIRRTIKNLESKEILITGNYNKMKIDKTKWYRIDYAKLVGVTSPCGQNDQSNRSNWSDASGQNDHTNNQRVPEITTDIYIDYFEKFWSVYPRKIDKKRAMTKFKTALKHHPIETILKGTKKYAQSVQHTEKKFIKHPATFLNNESFLDGVDDLAQVVYEEKNEPQFLF